MLLEDRRDVVAEICSEWTPYTLIMTRMDWSNVLLPTSPRLVVSTRRGHVMRTALIFVIFASTVFSRVIRTPKFLCEENGYFLNPYNCSGFYLCVDGVAEWHPCPDHLHPRWESPERVYCDIPENVNCTSLYARAIADQRAPESGRYEDVCSGRPDGVYRDPTYCFRFVMCSSGFRLDFDCPNGMSYDRATGICVSDKRCVYDGKGHRYGEYKGTAEGHMDGEYKGTAEGHMDGEYKGTAEGHMDGEYKGTAEGHMDGEYNGTAEGHMDGMYNSTAEGHMDGMYNSTAEGHMDGMYNSTAEGHMDGMYNGTAEGHMDGMYNDTAEGQRVGKYSGTAEGHMDGEYNGTAEGHTDGMYNGNMHGEYSGTAEDQRDGEYNGTVEDDGMKLAGMRSGEPIEVVEMGSGTEDVAPGEDTPSPSHGYVKLKNKRVEQLKRNIDSVLNQVHNDTDSYGDGNGFEE